MQFSGMKVATDRLGLQCTFLCYRSVIALIRPCSPAGYFFSNSHFKGQFLQCSLYFPCYLQGTVDCTPGLRHETRNLCASASEIFFCVTMPCALAGADTTAATAKAAQRFKLGAMILLPVCLHLGFTFSGRDGFAASPGDDAALSRHSRTRRKRSAFPTTLSEESAIAAAAMIGERRMRRNG